MKRYTEKRRKIEAKERLKMNKDEDEERGRTEVYKRELKKEERGEKIEEKKNSIKREPNSWGRETWDYDKIRYL